MAWARSIVAAFVVVVVFYLVRFLAAVAWHVALGAAREIHSRWHSEDECDPGPAIGFHMEPEPEPEEDPLDEPPGDPAEDPPQSNHKE